MRFRYVLSRPSCTFAIACAATAIVATASACGVQSVLIVPLDRG